MARPDDGGMAFPARHTPEHSDGMSFRDYVATQALAGMMANGWIPREYAPTTEPWTREHYARAAYGMADSMIAQRKAGK